MLTGRDGGIGFRKVFVAVSGKDNASASQNCRFVFGDLKGDTRKG